MNNKGRALGASEKVFWLLDQVSPVHFVMGAEIDGPIEDESLRSALKNLQRIHPMLSVAIDVRNVNNPAFILMDEVPIPVRKVAGFSAEQVKIEMGRELSTPFNLEYAPLVRLVHIKDENKNCLIIAVQHSIADGISGLHIFNNLLMILSGHEVGQRAFPPSIDDLLQLTDGVDAKAGEVRTGLTRKPEADVSVGIIELTPALTKAVINAAKENDTTVHGTICAAFVLAISQLASAKATDNIRLVSPVSLREGLTAGDDVALYIGVNITAFNTDQSSGFWSIARYAKEQIKVPNDWATIKAGYEPLRQWLFSGATPQEISDGLQNTVIPRELMISNLGRWPFTTEFGAMKLNAIHGPLALSGYPGDFTVGAITTGERLSLSLATRANMDNILKTAYDILVSNCQS